MNAPASSPRLATPLPARRRITLSPELLHLIDHDPRFAISTLDGRWLNPYNGEALDAPQGLRVAAIQHFMSNADWRERRPLGMGEVAVRKHYHDLLVLLAQDERFRIRDRSQGCWVNPYTGNNETMVQLSQDMGVDAAQRMLMARCLARTGHLSNGMQPLNRLLTEERHILPLVGEHAGAAVPVKPGAEQVRRTATAVFRGLPQIAGWECAADARSYDAVGGDFYEMHRMDEDHLLVALGDVSGHGMHGAKLATALLKHLRRLLQETQNITDLAQELNRECCQSLPKGSFITLFLCSIDLRDGSASILNCGHHQALLINPQSDQLVQTVGSAGMALGFTHGDIFAQRLQLSTCTIAPGAMLVQCSDGILEAATAGGEEFGLHRYAATVLGHSHASCRHVVQHLLKAARSWRGAPIEDDCTVLALRRIAPSDQA
ncbi:MAG: serine/threonine-protein phosphatase [Planctomycetota bacterium]|nr:MAG: serine/threonine-protein phosphatase [Planctomycetota bacterium]